MPAEFWLSADGSKTFLVVRSGINEGGMRRFSEQFTTFATQCGFKNVAIVTSTGSPVSRERQTNRQIPELFAYCNNMLFKEKGASFYKDNSVRKFGFWLDDSGIQRKRPHMELGELMGAGWAGRLLKAFNQVELPTVMLTIFTSGGIDFVGGYYLYQLMKKPLFSDSFGKIDF